MSMYSRMRVSGLANFSPWKSSITRRPLVPRPRKNRPPVMRSMFSAVIARFAGERAKTGTMLVPMARGRGRELSQGRHRVFAPRLAHREAAVAELLGQDRRLPHLP